MTKTPICAKMVWRVKYIKLDVLNIKENVTMNIKTTSLDLLFNKTKNYTTTKEFKELLSFFTMLRRISPYNAMLVKIQRPGCSFVAYARDWELVFKRKVNIDANPIVILRPFGPVAFVYDLADTTGKELPDHIVNPFEKHDYVPCKYMLNIMRSMLFCGIDYVEKEQGLQLGGYIYNDNEKEISIQHAKKQYSIKINYSLVVNEKLSTASKFAAIAHELGHYFCGHFDKRYNLSKSQEEFEAECVSYIVCNRLGIESNSERYLWGYLDDNDEVPEIRIDRILKVAGKIESMYMKVTPPKKKT